MCIVTSLNGARYTVQYCTFDNEIVFETNVSLDTLWEEGFEKGFTSLRKKQVHQRAETKGFPET
jgi:hypothetical protein